MRYGLRNYWGVERTKVLCGVEAQGAILGGVSLEKGHERWPQDSDSHLPKSRGV